jgi:hypothetical protein
MPRSPFATSRPLLTVGVIPAALALFASAGHGQPTPRRSAVEVFPDGGLFAPLLADPYDPAFRQRFVNGTGDRNPTVTLIGITEQGGRFGLVRWQTPGEGVVQVEIAGSVSAQFDLSATHWDLLNTDYTIGFPFTYQRGETSLRLRVYHQSSHLGDEFVRRDSIWIWGDPEPPAPGDAGYHASYRYESVELLAARRWRGWRVYGGGEYFWFVAPWLLERWVGRGGLEHRAPIGDGTESGVVTELVSAADVRMTKHRDWAPGVSLRAGIEVGRRGEGGGLGRRLGVLAEYFTGPAPFGQFQMVYDVTYYGAGFYIYW